MMRNWQWLVLALALAFTCAAPAAQAPGAKRYQAGVEAYRAGQYEKALTAFLDARRRGLRDGNVDFNLGLTYYRLGRYPEARATFTRLRTDLRYTAVADYHLGLVAAQQGESEDAVYYMTGAKAMAMNAGLRGLADSALRQEALHELPRVDGETITRNFVSTYYLLVGTGYDTNPSLVSDSLQLADEPGDTPYVELSGDARQALLPRLLGPVSVAGSLRLRDYSEHNSLDETSGELGLRRRWQGGAWSSSAAALAGVDTLGGAVFQRMAGVDADWRHTLGAGFLGLDYRSERLTGGDGFEYLEGWRHRAGVSYRSAVGAFRLRSDYSFTYNDRQDLDRGDEFFSHSPVRQSVGVSLGRSLRYNLNLEMRTRYRSSRYRDADRFTQDSSTVVQRREEDLLQAGLRSRLLLANGWNGLLDYQFSQNRSTRETSGYDRHLLLLGIEWLK